MTLSPSGATQLLGDQLMPAFTKERERLSRIDRWWRWSHDKPHQPRQSTREYRELSARSETPWLGLVVTAVAQSLYVEGYRHPRDPENATGWSYWQANGLDARQIPVHRSTLAYGLSYATVLPGTTLTGDPMPVIRGKSPRRFIAFYDDVADDDWPMYALSAEPAKVAGANGWSIKVYDDENIYRFLAGSNAGPFTFIDFEAHDIGVCPAVRFANSLDLEGRADGEVEPLIPVAGRIDQTIFDRLVVQRFSSWVVRTIAGMSPPEGLNGEALGPDAAQQALELTKMRLKVEDILVADDPDTKFGSLPASPLDGFISAKDADIRDLAAVSQTPPHHLLGVAANLSAEALAAAEASLSRKVVERKHLFGESWEQVLRLAAHVNGDDTGASDLEAQVRWADMESRSLAQAADALGKLATMLGVPPEMLWEKIPGWTDQDVQRAKDLAKKQGGMQALIDALGTGATSKPPPVAPQPMPGPMPANGLHP
jgi:hypothetical protein